MRVEVVDKHDAVSYEHLVLDGDAFANEGVAGDLATSADHRVFLDLDEGADTRMVTDSTPVQVHEAMNRRVRGYLNVRGDSEEIRWAGSLVHVRFRCRFRC